MKTRMLGKNGPQISQIGLGCMGMSDLYGSKETRDDKESLATINLAVEASDYVVFYRGKKPIYLSLHYALQ